MARKGSFLAIVRDNGQRYVYVFDDTTTDAQLRRIWRRDMRDPELDFDRACYRVLCQRLRLHRQQMQSNILPLCESEQDLGKLMDTAFDENDDDACHGK